MLDDIGIANNFCLFFEFFQSKRRNPLLVWRIPICESSFPSYFFSLLSNRITFIFTTEPRIRERKLYWMTIEKSFVEIKRASIEMVQLNTKACSKGTTRTVDKSANTSNKSVCVMLALTCVTNIKRYKNYLRGCINEN